MGMYRPTPHLRGSAHPISVVPASAGYADVHVPHITNPMTHHHDAGHGFEQARIYLGPDGLLHMTATSYAGFEPHFVSADNNFGVRWSLAEKMVDWGAPIHELTPVYPATAAGPPGDSGGVPQYFIQFDGSPFRLDLLKVHWGEVPAPAP